MPHPHSAAPDMSVVPPSDRLIDVRAVVHESAYVDADVQIGPETCIWHFSHVLPGSRIGSGCRIGQNVVIGPRVTIGSNVKIQNNVSVYEGVTLEDDVFCGPSMVFTNIATPRSAFPRNRPEDNQPTLVKRGASIGANATIVCGCTIGAHALIGAGAVVTRDVPPHAVFYGNPARHHGWACECGVVLRFAEQVTACGECGRRYRKLGEDAIVCDASSSSAADAGGAGGEKTAAAEVIPVFDARLQYQELKDEIDAAMQTVAAAGHYILGPQVKAFEQEMAAALSCSHAIGVANGTDALHLALRALRIGPGDEVITTPFTFVATTEAIGLVGATPVFVDIDPQTYNIDPLCIEAAITPRTRAIIPVHLYGRPCDMDRIMSIARANDLHVVEDCAQALGATYRGRPVGSFGTVGCLSFFPSKNLGCMGDGGMLVTSDPELSDRIEMLRRHGGKVKYHHEELGLNSRLDELQAAILRVKLPYLARWNAARRAIAGRYTQGLSDIAAVNCPIHRDEDLAGHVFHQYTLRVPDRDTLTRDLAAAGISTAVYYPVPLHLQGVHAGLPYGQGSLPHAERAASECLSLPMFPGLTALQVERVVAACHRSLAAATRQTANPTTKSLQAA